MITVLLVIHILIAIALIVVVLLQRSEGGGLGIGGGGGMGGFMTARGTANLLTRTTAILAGVFMVMSLVLAILASRPGEQRRSIIDSPNAPSPAIPAPQAPQAPAPAPETPAAPAPPVAR
jgi:preprotein translocase subunit SecG